MLRLNQIKLKILTLGVIVFTACHNGVNNTHIVLETDENETNILIQGTVKGANDSLPVESVLVLIIIKPDSTQPDYDNQFDWRSEYTALTDNNGRYEKPVDGVELSEYIFILTGKASYSNTSKYYEIRRYEAGSEKLGRCTWYKIQLPDHYIELEQ